MRKTALGIVLALLFLAASCLTLPLPVNAAPRTIVVPDNYPTISSAISNATNGDTVYVKNGVYSEFSLVIKKSIWLVGEDAKSTVIRLDSPKP
jgi:hypothetical protein